MSYQPRSNYFNVDNGDGSQSPGSTTPGETRSLGSRRLARAGSFAALRDSAIWLGEQAQTAFLDLNLEAHNDIANNNHADNNDAVVGLPITQIPRLGSYGGVRSVTSIPKFIAPSSSLSHLSYNSLDNCSTEKYQTIRFQVIVWSIGCPDVKNDTVSMKFRVTLFWNDQSPPKKEETNLMLSSSDKQCGGKSRTTKNKTKAQTTTWVMTGRNAAYKKKITDYSTDLIDVPPISILNADSFEVIGQPEVQILREETLLMRWSCMYRAQLKQDDMRVHEFPHDKHKLTLKLGILSQRQSGGRWDNRKWKLALATESDTQGSIRIPYGLIVDNVKIPGFEADEGGLDFALSELNHGSISALQALGREKDFYLKVKLNVKRDSGYYDKNIMPLLSFLNLVSISILTLNGDKFFQRGLMCLNIAFVEIGLRMQLDNRLPSVGYQIKMQRILNRYFYSILSIVLESSLLHFLIEHGDFTVRDTRKIDAVWAIFLLLNQAFLTLVYADFDRFAQFRENDDASSES